MTEPSSPNGWAKDFLYGFDPKFIMAMTAKLNMVLHGDGVAHLFKEDAYKPMEAYQYARLRPNSGVSRSVKEAKYAPKMCENFDVIISNPPFGVTLSPETRNALSSAFELPETSSTEALFIERAFQLLRPGGRLAVVLPESVFNGSDAAVRMFLLRMFHLRGVVTMPRGIFVDTPTLTSLLFAQKKSSSEIELWEEIWADELGLVEARVAAARTHLRKGSLKKFKSMDELEAAILFELDVIGSPSTWVMKRGKKGGIMNFKISDRGSDLLEAAEYYRELLNTPGFDDLVNQAVFSAVAQRLDADWPCYIVDEVGFKLCRRGERVRKNQLATFIGDVSGRQFPNLHLATESVNVLIDRDYPKTVLDFMITDMVWN